MHRGQGCPLFGSKADIGIGSSSSSRAGGTTSRSAIKNPSASSAKGLWTSECHRRDGPRGVGGWHPRFSKNIKSHDPVGVALIQINMV